MSDVNYRRSAVWDVKLRFHPPKARPEEGTPIITLTVAADNYEDAIDGAIWAAIDVAVGRSIKATEEDYEVIGVDRIRGCTIV